MAISHRDRQTTLAGVAVKVVVTATDTADPTLVAVEDSLQLVLVIVEGAHCAVVAREVLLARAARS